MRALRVIRWAVGCVVALALLPIVAVAAMLTLSLPGGDATLHVAGLSAPVRVTLDADDVPRIQANTLADAAAAMGYVHARDRMFQMELMRRAASGRIAEIAGGAALPVDRMMRTLGLRVRAEADARALPAETRALLEAYARGVNAWIAARGRFSSMESLALGTPEPWTVTDCLLWGETMSLYLSGNWRQHLARAALPQDRVDLLWPTEDGAQPADAHAGDRRFAGLADHMLSALPAFPDRFTQPDHASDEWAVDGRHSVTGAPLLAGDPHLGFALPGLWFLARIDTPEGVMAGATSPGVPFIILGHNGHVAWTFTSTGADVQDVFEETVLPDGRYQTPDGPRAFDVRTEIIHVRGQPDVSLRVRETVHGPVMSDLDATPGPTLAVAMMNLQPGSAAPGLLALDRARNVAEAGEAAERIFTPVQNMLVADHDRIALFTIGRVPVRKAGDGSRPQPGADGAHDWIGTASGEDLPRIVAPFSGHLLNGNERVLTGAPTAFMGRDFPADFRARRIRTLLDRQDPFSVADFASMQVDIVSAFAQAVLPALRAVHPADGLPLRAAAMLATWDGAMDANRPEPLIFNAWVQALEPKLLARAGVPPRAAGPWPDVVAAALAPRQPATAAAWCGGDCAPLLVAALTDAMSDLAGRFGSDPARWRWGAAHQVVFAHPVLGALPVVAPLATIRRPVSGDETTLLRGGNGRPGQFDSVHGAGFRGVYDLADLSRSLVIAVPGQSGHLLSPHAYDMVERWRMGAGMTLGPVATRVTATLRLEP